MHYPYYFIVPGLASVCCLLLRCCNDDMVSPAKILYTKRDLMSIYCALGEISSEFETNT